MLRVGIADHFGWAVAVTASSDHAVVDRRRIELVEPGTTPAPIHYESKHLDVVAASALLDEWRASATRATARSLDALDADMSGPIGSVSLRALPETFPDDVATLVRPPYEARADAVMYRRVLAQAARDRGWDVHFYDAKSVLARAGEVLRERAAAVLDGPGAVLGPPWTKDHRLALAATVISS